MFKRVLENKLFADTVWYTLSIVFARGLSLIVFPLLVKTLNEPDLLRYDLALANIVLVMSACIFGVDSAVGRLLKNKEIDRVGILNASYVMIVLQSIPSLIIFFIYIHIFEFELAWYDQCVLVTLIYCLLVVNQATNTAKWLLERSKVVKIQVTLGVAQSLLLLLAFVFGVLSFSVAIAAQMTGAFIAAVYSCKLLQTKIRFCNLIQIMKSLFRNSFFLGLNTFIGALYVPLEKNFIFSAVNEVAAASYIIHFKVGTLFTFGMSAFQMSFTPNVIDNLRNGQKLQYVVYILLVILISSVTAILYFLMASYVFRYFSTDHTYSYYTMSLILSIQLVILICSLLESIYVFHEKYRIIFFLNFALVVTFVVVCLMANMNSVNAFLAVAAILLVTKLIIMAVANIWYLSNYTQ